MATKAEEDTARKLRMLTVKVMLLTGLIITVVALALTIQPTKPEHPSITDVTKNVVKSGGGILAASTAKEKTSFTSKVLGAKTAVEKKVVDTGNGAKKFAIKKAAAIVYTFTVKPLVDNFDKLPKEQKLEVEKKICD